MMMEAIFLRETSFWTWVWWLQESSSYVYQLVCHQNEAHSSRGGSGKGNVGTGGLRVGGARCNLTRPS